MQLSATELARLEEMFASGKVRSDPPAPCNTDRTVDAIVAAAQMKEKARTSRQGTAHTQPAAIRAESPLRHAGTAAADQHMDWNLPRSLEQLIEIRRALMRDEAPEL